MMLMVAGDVTQEELEAAMAGNVGHRGHPIPHPGNSRTPAKHSYALSHPMDVRNGVIKQIRVKESLSDNQDSNEMISVPSRHSQRRDSCSEHLKEMLRENHNNSYSDNDDMGNFSSCSQSLLDVDQTSSSNKRKHGAESSEYIIDSKHSSANVNIESDSDSRLVNTSSSNNNEPISKRKKVASVIDQCAVQSDKCPVQPSDHTLVIKDSLLPYYKNYLGVSETSTNGDAFSLSNISPDALCDLDPGVKDDAYFIALSKSIPDDLFVAMDCEFVGTGVKGRNSALARCSILDYNGNVIYDKYVRPEETITDFRTRWSGIKPSHMRQAVPIELAVRVICGLLADKIVVGHAVYNDFKVLGMTPAAHTVRDTTGCPHLTDRAGFPRCKTGLKKLTEAVLGRKIQVGRKGHCSVEDALASLDLFKLVRNEWEPQLLRAWEKKGVDMVRAVREMRGGARADDFLADRYWPNHMTG